MNKNTLVVPGLWFNPKGPIGQQLTNKGFTLVDLCGLPTQEYRTDMLVGAIRRNKEATTLIGHSAGCITVIETLLQFRELGEKHNITEVLLMNSGPLPGIKFMPWDPTFWVTPKYTWSLLMGKDFCLSRNDVKNLLSTEEADLDEMMANLKPDSGRFVKEVVMRQYKPALKDVVDLGNNIEVTIVHSVNDRMIGSTGPKTSALIFENYEFTIGAGHMWTMMNLPKVLEEIAD